MKLLNSVLKKYHRIDNDTRRIRRAAGIKCPTGCGNCCDNPRVTASVIELLPLSRQIWRQGKAYDVLDRLHTTGPDTCIFYQPHDEGCGSCSAYALRPLACRLFGFSFRLNKYEAPELVTCQIIKTGASGKIQQLETLISQGWLKPLWRHLIMNNIQSQISNIDPGPDSRLLPINTAIRNALEKTGLFLQYDYTACDIRPAVLEDPPVPPENDDDSSPPVMAA